mgnify:CR=1 FL=1|jgi:hypothetical protein
MVKVSKIEIEIGGVQVSITPEQARELYQALGELVGEKEVVERVERVIERERCLPYRWYTFDGYSWTIPASTGDQPLKPPYTITCQNDNTSGESAIIKLSTATSSWFAQMS